MPETRSGLPFVSPERIRVHFSLVAQLDPEGWMNYEREVVSSMRRDPTYSSLVQKLAERYPEDSRPGIAFELAAGRRLLVLAGTVPSLTPDLVNAAGRLGAFEEESLGFIANTYGGIIVRWDNPYMLEFFKKSANQFRSTNTDKRDEVRLLADHCTLYALLASASKAERKTTLSSEQQTRQDSP